MGQCCCKCCSKTGGNNKDPPESLPKKLIPVDVKRISIREDYLIGNNIGNEKFAALHKCRNKITGDKFVVKIFSVEGLEEKILEAFLIENVLLRKADHPNIIKVKDIYMDSTNVYILTEYYNGGELIERIKNDENLSENKVALYMQQIISSVSYLHSNNIIHRDLRFESIMFLNKESDSCLKLVEFGSCKHFENNIQVLERVGSPYFMSPEGIIGNFDSKCDVWSLGIMMYILLSGSPPFVGSTESEIMQSILSTKLQFNGRRWRRISDEAKNLIRAMLNCNPEERPTAKQVLNDTWIKQRANNSVAESMIIESTLYNLNQFYTEIKLQRATLAFIVSQITRSNNVGNLKKVFEKINSSDDGLLSEWEIRRALVSNSGFDDDYIEHLIAIVKFDENGKANYSELITLADNLDKEMSRKMLVEAFNNLDADHSGKISKEELMAAFGGSHRSSRIFEEMINEADTNHDGEIDLDEFCNYMEKPK